MTVQAGKAAARSYFDEVLNNGNMVVADAIFTPAVRFQYPLGDLNGVPQELHHRSPGGVP